MALRKLFQDNYQGPEYRIGEPELPQLVRNPDAYIEHMLAELRLGEEFPKKIGVMLFGFRPVEKYYDRNSDRFISSLPYTIVEMRDYSASAQDDFNRQQLERAWEHKTAPQLLISKAFREKHIGDARKVDIGFFKRVVRRAKGLSNDVWYFVEPKTESSHSEVVLS